MMKYFLFILSLVLFQNSYAQQSSQLDTAVSFPMFHLAIGFHNPSGDLADRFGIFNSVEAGFSYKHKSNFFVSGEGNFLFGNDIKDLHILDDILTPNGYIIDNGGALANLQMDMRGFSIFGNVGYLIPVLSPNPNSGFVVKAGAGFLQHHIKIDYRDSQPPHLDEEYRKGYDRLSNGLAFNAFFGYQYLSKKRLINFYLGIDYINATTSNKRTYNFDSGPDTKSRNDVATGLKFGWILPLYRSIPADYYYY